MLENIQILSMLQVGDIKSIEKICRIQRLAASERFGSAREMTRDVYFLVEGKANIVIYTKHGKAIIIRRVEAGQTIGEVLAFGHNLASAVFEAAEDCIVASLKVPDFLTILEKYPSVRLQLFEHLSGRIRDLAQHMVELSSLSARGRICAELLRLSRSRLGVNGSAIIFPAPTHAVIADQTNTQRETVTRELSRLTRAGIIERDGKSLWIKDRSLLIAMIDDLEDDWKTDVYQ